MTWCGSGSDRRGRWWRPSTTGTRALRAICRRPAAGAPECGCAELDRTAVKTRSPGWGSSRLHGTPERVERLESTSTGGHLRATVLVDVQSAGRSTRRTSSGRCRTAVDRVGRRRARSAAGPAAGRRRGAQRRPGGTARRLAARDLQRLRAVVGPDGHGTAARTARDRPGGAAVAHHLDDERRRAAGRADGTTPGAADAQPGGRPPDRLRRRAPWHLRVVEAGRGPGGRRNRTRTADRVDR